jgi:hypothetical protein
MLIDLNTQYVDNGVIYAPRVIDPAQVDVLRTLSEHCLAQWRTKPNARGQFPWFGSTVMRHLNHPGYYPRHRHWLVEALNFIANPKIISIVEEVLGDQVLFRCMSLFMNPLRDGNEGNWHRDSQFSNPDPEIEKTKVLAEADRLAATRKSSGIQLQIALIPSDHSQFVPGSHRRWDTDEEFYIRRSNDQKYIYSNLMPNAITTHQEPGDVAAFHHNGIHRGRYWTHVYRRTLMLTFTSMAAKPIKDEFTYQPWCLDPNYLDGVKPETKAFFNRFTDVYKEYLSTPQTEPSNFLPVW